MSFFRAQAFAVTLVLIAVGFLVACEPTPTLIPASIQGIGVGITSDSCPSVLVQVGQQVSWTNQDEREHIVHDISSDGNAEFDSGPLQPGGHFEFTFLNPGTYTYECSTDGSMKGTITVEP